jgi:multidrug efflux pump subunit AcrB
VNLSEPFIRRPVATSLVMAAIAFVGIAAFPFLPVASLPQIDFPTIQVTATLAGASAETMAVSVATPLERQFSQISGITQMTSLSTLGAAQVVIQFDLNRNIDAAAQDVQAAISIAGKTLPQNMTLPPTYRRSIRPTRQFSFLARTRRRCRSPESTNTSTAFSPSRYRRCRASGRLRSAAIGALRSVFRWTLQSLPRWVSPWRRFAQRSSAPRMILPKVF